MHGTGANPFGSSSSSQSAFPALSQSRSSSQLFPGFGQTSAAGAFGQASAPSSSSSPWPTASSASGVASTFGSFGFGQSSSSASQGGSSGPAASPFGKGLSFGYLSSSSAAAAPTSSSGGVGGFGQQGFAASQASGVTMLLLCIWKPKFTTTIMSTLSSLQQHADKVYHNSYGDESSRMHACKCCYVTLSAQHSLAESLNEFFGLQVPPSLSAALAPLGGALGSPPPPPPLLAISPQVTSCPYEACNDLCHDRVLCFWPCILKAEFFTVLV